jgi:tetratricopeptide (TPR) repeat protein
MRLRSARLLGCGLLVFTFLLNLPVRFPRVSAQARHEADAHQAKREKALEFFAAGKRLEALPLLEELAKENPKDDGVLVDLAASLVEHAATLDDMQAAGKERLRARELLDKAWDLGNTSPLALNLSQLLRQLPSSGGIKFSDNLQVEQMVEAGEAAFSRRDFEQAIRDYSKALEVEPANYSAALFTANAFDREDESEKAAQWYERAIQIDPNVETAYRYYADMVAKRGDMAKARTLLIHAAVAEPYNRIVWRELQAWATLNNTQINLVYVGIPALPPKEGEPGRADRNSQQPAEAAAPWAAYWSVKANWQQGDEFKKHFPETAEYRHSLPEEFAALNAAAEQWEKIRENEKTKELVANDASAALLLRLSDAGLLEPYVLFSLGDDGIARDYSAYRATSRKKLEDYLARFVVPSC